MEPLPTFQLHPVVEAKVVHQAYSEGAELVILPLEFYGKQYKEKILQFVAS